MALPQTSVFVLQSLQQIDILKIIRKQYIWVWSFSVLVLQVL